ncbi:MAG TPA: threonine/serine dehydratase [Methylomirabilota bacterium]|nr:threonine/serine dehydratase [Methylomirabilota bacterium]
MAFAAPVADPWPIRFTDVLEAERRIRPYLPPTPLRTYGALDAAVGAGIRVWVKHENFQPTNAFKVRNGLALVTALSDAERRRGVVAATRGNHGLGVAWAAALLGCPVTVCVPEGNNPEKNEAITALGARLVVGGRDYDESVQEAQRLMRHEGLVLAHSTNDPRVIAGAATITLEILREQPSLDALVVAVGGGSQAVGALVAARELAPALEVYAVQAEGAAAIHDSWHAGRVVTRDAAVTFADGLATRGVYEMTFPALQAGLAGFVAVPDAEIAEALRILLRTTHTLVEGAGAAGLAGLLRLRERLTGRRVGIILSGGNIDLVTLGRVLAGTI